jgi:hypothetical protein
VKHLDHFPLLTGAVKMSEKHSNDHCIFNVPSVVLINLKTDELHLIDKVSFGFGSTDEGRPLDEELVKNAGFEILGEL